MFLVLKFLIILSFRLFVDIQDVFEFLSFRLLNDIFLSFDFFEFFDFSASFWYFSQLE
jgi:hypothetical protein